MRRGEARAEAPGRDVRYIWGTAILFLKTKEALDKGEVVTIHPVE